jgi:hypothetical protein
VAGTRCNARRRGGAGQTEGVAIPTRRAQPTETDTLSDLTLRWGLLAAAGIAVPRSKPLACFSPTRRIGESELCQPAVVSVAFGQRLGEPMASIRLHTRQGGIEIGSVLRRILCRLVEEHDLRS